SGLRHAPIANSAITPAVAFFIIRLIIMPTEGFASASFANPPAYLPTPGQPSAFDTCCASSTVPVGHSPHGSDSTLSERPNVQPGVTTSAMQSPAFATFGKSISTPIPYRAWATIASFDSPRPSLTPKLPLPKVHCGHVAPPPVAVDCTTIDRPSLGGFVTATIGT